MAIWFASGRFGLGCDDPIFSYYFRRYGNDCGRVELCDVYILFSSKHITELLSPNPRNSKSIRRQLITQGHIKKDAISHNHNPKRIHVLLLAGVFLMRRMLRPLLHLLKALIARIHLASIRLDLQ